MTLNYTKLLSLIERVARDAGKYLLTQTISVKNHKTRNDLLTENDLVIENFIIDGIRKEYPDIHIVSEEYNPDNDLDGLTVVIDPIDGTCNFAQGLSLYGTSAAARCCISPWRILCTPPRRERVLTKTAFVLRPI